MKYKKKISICMIIKNEEKNLSRCLNSVKPIVDSGLAELIIIDTGSEDRSIEISKEYTDKVYEHPWGKSFSEMRNISISYAVGEWVWVIDADEEIETPEEMIKLFQEDLSGYNTITIEMRNYISTSKREEQAQYSTSVLNRAFRNKKNLKYKGNIHEQINNEQPVLNSNIIVGHYGYIWEDENFIKMKFERNIGILKKELESNPGNIYYQFQLASSYSVIDDKKGLDEIRIAKGMLEKLSYTKKLTYLYIYGVYAKIVYANKKYAEVIEVSKEGLSFTKDYIDLWYFMGMAYVAINDEDMALETLKEFLKCKKRFYRTQISKDTAFNFYCLDEEAEESVLYNIILIYISKNEYDHAIRYLNMVEPSDSKSQLIITVGIEGNRHDVIIDYLKEINQPDIMSQFIDALEYRNIEQDKRQSVERDMLKIISENDSAPDSYHLLNIIRSGILKKEPINNGTLQRIMNVDYTELGDYYGDIIVYIIKQNLDLSVLKNMGDSENLNRFIKYIMEKHEDTQEEIINYLYRHEQPEDISDLRCWIDLARNVLIYGDLQEDTYQKLFEKYRVKGNSYIQQIYHSNILKDENAYEIYNKEHRFFMYLEKAQQLKETDIKAYIQYLRKALNTYPMKVGIELLIKDIEKNQVEKGSEMELYKKQVKDNIKSLINTGNIEDAMNIINKYEQTIRNDIQILSMKAIILIIQQRFSDAKEILTCALKIKPKDEDLLYNLNYVNDALKEESYISKT